MGEKNLQISDKSGLLENGKPVYRLLTGIDDKNFCIKVSEALLNGYELYGSPAICFDGKNNIAAQAVIWKGLKKALEGFNN